MGVYLHTYAVGSVIAFCVKILMDEDVKKVLPPVVMCAHNADTSLEGFLLVNLLFIHRITIGYIHIVSEFV